ncbi:MAG: YciI family protein [Rhodomicrobium sp.]
MRFVAILNAGRAWIEGESVKGQDRAVMLAHLQAMRRRYDEGTVLFGGPFRTGDGGIVLLEAPSRPDAKTVLESDPAVGAGVLDYTLFEVRPYFDVIAGEAWPPKT